MIRKAETNEDDTMVFVNEDHYAFFKHTMKNAVDDTYHRALMYALGIDKATRSNWTDLFDETTQHIKPNGMNAIWQGETSQNVTRLAFQLFSDRPITAIYDSNGDDIQDFKECWKYSVSDIFNSNYALYFVQAIKLRYPEYFDTKKVIQVESLIQAMDDNFPMELKK